MIFHETLWELTQLFSTRVYFSTTEFTSQPWILFYTHLLRRLWLSSVNNKDVLSSKWSPIPPQTIEQYCQIELSTLMEMFYICTVQLKIQFLHWSSHISNAQLPLNRIKLNLNLNGHIGLVVPILEVQI